MSAEKEDEMARNNRKKMKNKACLSLTVVKTAVTTKADLCTTLTVFTGYI